MTTTLANQLPRINLANGFPELKVFDSDSHNFSSAQTTPYEHCRDSPVSHVTELYNRRSSSHTHPDAESFDLSCPPWLMTMISILLSSLTESARLIQ